MLPIRQTTCSLLICVGVAQLHGARAQARLGTRRTRGLPTVDGARHALAVDQLLRDRMVDPRCARSRPVSACPRHRRGGLRLVRCRHRRSWMTITPPLGDVLHQRYTHPLRPINVAYVLPVVSSAVFGAHGYCLIHPVRHARSRRYTVTRYVPRSSTSSPSMRTVG